MPRLKAENE